MKKTILELKSINELLTFEFLIPLKREFIEFLSNIDKLLTNSVI